MTPGKNIPEIKWKTFRDDNGVAHVGPSIDNELMTPHHLDLRCACVPTRDYTRNSLIIVHHVIH